MQPDADSRCSSIYSYAFRDYVSGQLGPRSACANARADSGLRFRKLPRGLFVRCASYNVVLDNYHVYVEIRTHSLEVYIFGEKHCNMFHANKEFVFCIVLLLKNYQ